MQRDYSHAPATELVTGDAILAYGKATELLHLAMEIAAQRYGLSYARIDDLSTAGSKEGRRRNTQRMVSALENVFGERLSTSISATGEKTVHLKGDSLRQLIDLTPEEMTALDHAITVLNAASARGEADALQALRAKIRLLTPEPRMSRIDVDYEALLSGSHMAVRSGPTPYIDPDVMRPLTEAILSLRQVAFDYTNSGTVKRRIVHPYGVIFGYRAYLVARMEGAAGPSHWRIDRIQQLQMLNAASERPEDFDLASHAKRGFGSFHKDAEYGPVEWRFSAKVAEAARSFRFHPDQQITDEPDGTVTIRFCASGHLEMVWALYPWGDNVEVIHPEHVRQMIADYRRGDFPAVP